MEFFAALALAVGFAWLIKSIGSVWLDRPVGALAQLVGGWRPDSWPRGLQEEDRDRPWGKTPASPAQSVPSLSPPLVRVHPVVRAR